MKSPIRYYYRSSQKHTGYEWFVSVIQDRITGLYHVNAQDNHKTIHRIYFQAESARQAAAHYVYSTNLYVNSMIAKGN